MKSIKMILAAVLVCGAMSVQAQDYYETKHEIGISVGALATSQLINSMEDFATIGTSLGTVSYDNESNVPAIAIDYYYHVTKGVAVGAILGYSGRTQDILIAGKKNGEAKRSTFSLIPTVKFDWLRKKNIGLYSKIGAGVSMMSDSQKYENNSKKQNDTRFHFNFQASLIGFEFGSENFRGFTELGVGQQGMALAGLRYKF